MKERFTLQIKGDLARGGFMPLLWRLVPECKYVVSGYAEYNGEGVLLVLEGEGNQVMNYLRLLPKKIPFAYKLSALTLLKRQIADDFNLKNRGFRIRRKDEKIAFIRPDMAPCSKCVEELHSKESRRYQYPFFACKDCGPSYVFANILPFTRQNSSVVAFPACNTCKQEMRDEKDMHHHGAELLCCPDCGPRHFVLDMYGDLVDNEKPFRVVRRELAAGKIVAMQSVFGGFRLLADACNEESVLQLRRKKKNPDMAFSLLFKDLETVRKYCQVSEKEAELLVSLSAPYVFLKRRKDSPFSLPSCIAPDTQYISAGLPSSLSEYLLFEKAEEEDEKVPEMPDVLVTSGDNSFGHAECLDTDEIFNRLMAYTDCFLCHDLKTSLACPNTLCRVQNDVVRIFRRGRGIVPLPVPSTVGLASRRICASFGTDMHSAVALASSRIGIVPSQEQGHIANHAGAEILERMLDPLIDLFDCVPDIVACDMNSSLVSSAFASAYAEKYQLPLITVQTHHALALACMAEHGLENALALVFTKGKGAPDGTFWGAECLETKCDSFSRYASFAARKTFCRKNDFSGARPPKLLLEWFFDSGKNIDDALLKKLNIDRAEAEVWKKNYFANAQDGEYTHSAEYLFTSVTAALGLAPEFASFPGRCRGILEDLAGEEFFTREDVPEEIRKRFIFTVEEDDGCCFIHWEETIYNLAALGTLPENEKIFYIRAFYLAVGDAVVEMLRYASRFTDEKNVVLSGDVFKDGVLSRVCMEKLASCGYKVWQHEQTSPDASSVCIGQAYAALMS
ncbi:MAG: carbamoyltransferase HypF [Lentisphaeria bacterium]|nr:carbamoyltransferase HypF [Lentisphaeria bacterium]